MGSSEPVPERRLTILHTSDLHNKLDEESAARLRELKRSDPDSLMLDSGDAIWAGNAYWRPGGEPIFDLMNSVPYDAMCMGNREFHFLDAGIRAKLSKTGFPILSANLRSCAGKLASASVTVLPHAVFTLSGLRVAVFGLTVPCVTRGAFLHRVFGNCFDQPVPAGVKAAEALRAECDVLIALTHIGIERDRELARRAPGIDLILGGHTHTVTNEPERLGDTVILHCGSHARRVCRVAIEVADRPKVVSHDLLPLRGRSD